MLNFNKILEMTKEDIQKLSKEERDVAIKIISEYAETGQSQTLSDLFGADYNEIPVDIETFLTDKEYLGAGLINDEGKFTVFPYWVDVLKKLFPTNTTTAYRTLVLSGAIGLGKSFVAVLCILYQLYRMMCLKDPYVYYGLQPIDKITFSFMNITLDASKGVAWDKAQQLLQKSPWFMARGIVTGRENLTWNPPSGIELIAGSQPRHVIGRAVFSNFCLDGDTVVCTTNGDIKLRDLENQTIRVFSLDENDKPIISDECTVHQTVISKEEYQVELENCSIIKCTPNHKFLLTTGEYKEAQYLTLEDAIVSINFMDIAHINCMCMKIKSINHVILDEPKLFYDVISANPYNNFLIKTKDSYICSHNCDEISFVQNQDITKQIEKAKTLISTVDARMQSRFMKGEYNPTLHILASSKRTDQSFLETYIDNKKKNESKTTLIIDEPQWVIRTDKDSPNKFWVAVGNKFLNSEVLPLDISDGELNTYRNRGYSLLHVPMGYREQFIDDIDIALTDIAGISTSNTAKYISGPRLSATKNKDLHNPFIKDIIEVGNAPDDNVQYYDFFDESQISPELKSLPLYVHLDMSINGDKTGIAGTWIKGKKPPVEGQPPSKELMYRLAFSVAVKAPRGYQVSFEKNRQFIFWLKDNGFNVKGISSDSFQSAEFGQSMTAAGFNYTQISVDRVDPSTHICKPYQYLKSTIYEERIEMYDSVLLTDELIGLERNNNGKIDHSPSGINSKDTSDALCGSVWNASQHAEEFAFDYGETIDSMISVNNESNSELEYRKQLGNSLLQSLGINEKQTIIQNEFDKLLDDDILMW